MTDERKINFAALIDEYPSPTEAEQLERQIEQLRAAFSSPPENLSLNKLRIKLADLLVGQNGVGDYIEAGKLYNEVLTSSLPGEAEHSKALLGKAELNLSGVRADDITDAIDSCSSAMKSFEGEDCAFFRAKGNLLIAELLLKKGDEKSRAGSLRIYEETSYDEKADKYFKMRAAVGKLELLLYFYRALFEKRADDLISETADAVSVFEKSRPNDYFVLKGLIVLSEAKLAKDRERFKDSAKGMLSEVVNNDRASDDLRARASLDLAEVSSPALARTLIKGVRKIEGLDPYLIRKAKAIEDAL